ncbi:MAG: hypothetical protein PHR48_00565 [Candidatus ainarchaeum sp.]|nr:hypothetical protein [Candidatus ainarchaeum sp.]MDD4662355.1 hypothetical protein [Candidatus ainarchaeum sp.]
MVYKNTIKIKIFLIIISFIFLSSFISADLCELESSQITPQNAQLYNLGCDSSNQNCYFALISFPQSSQNNISNFGTCESACSDGNVLCYETCADDVLTPNLLSFSNILEISKNSACEGKNTTLILTSNIVLNIIGQDYDGNFSFGGTLRTNGHDVRIYVANDDLAKNNSLDMHTKFKFGIEDSKIILNKGSNITMDEEPRGTNACSSLSKERKYGVSLFLSDVVVEENNIDNPSEIKVIAKVDDDNPNICNPGDQSEEGNFGDIIKGGSSSLYFSSITNYGNLNIDVIAANGNKGYSWGKEYKGKLGGFGGYGGSVFLLPITNTNLIENYLNLNLNLKSGNGGLAGQGSESIGNTGSVGFGGNGGNSGNIDFNVFEINNYSIDSNLNISIISGNGGNGGDSGVDHGGEPTANFAHGGNGGNSSHIFWRNNTSVYNEGILDLNITAGNGGNGGKKIYHCDKKRSYAGNGGNAGTVAEIIFDNITNTFESKFNLDVATGKKGLITEKKESCIQNAVDGSPGRLYDLDIDYLDNKSKDLEIKMVSEDDLRNFNCDSYNYSNININYLQTRSYLPKTLHTVNVDKTRTSGYNSECRQININGCYVDTTSNVNYFTDKLNLSVTNNLDMDNIFRNQIAIGSKDIDYKYCPYCDIISLDNSSFRISQEYSLYSDKQGTIKANDLNIYYAYDSLNWDPSTWSSEYSNFNGIFKINVKNQKLPIYTNTEDIIPVYDDDLGLYEYKVTKDNLRWNYDPEYTFRENDYLYCAGQPYVLRGTLIVPFQSQKFFKIPFTPIFKISNTW